MLAQLPTVTAVSRQALVSGRRPIDFAATIRDNRAESALWSAFWTAQGLPADTIAYESVALDRDAASLAIEQPGLRVLCLVENSLDDIVHGATLGAADVHSSLRLWLDATSHRLEAAISALLARGFSVYLVSDHGHTEARGIGQPNEGLLVQTRSRRARVYRDRRLAGAIQTAFPSTILWRQDGLLPVDTWALMAPHGQAFAPHNEVVVTHGGATLDEVVVPFVAISRG